MDVTDRVVSVVTYLSSDRDFHGITEISTQLGISKSTVYRILSSLERHRWVAQDTKTRRYRLGNGTVTGWSLSQHGNKSQVQMTII